MNTLTKGASVTDLLRLWARSKPALQGACGKPDEGAGLLQACTGAAGLSNQLQHDVALFESDHLSSSSDCCKTMA